jgi:predicted dehydrogenase
VGHDLSGRPVTTFAVNPEGKYIFIDHSSDDRKQQFQLGKRAMASAKIPAVVAGTGFGCRIQVPALRAAGFDVVGLVGADAERTAERASVNAVPNAFTDIDEAITRTGAQAVAVSTPPHIHGQVALAAIARGCHVICEKPFAKDVAEGRSMLQAAERAGVVHMVGHEFRFVPERAMMARVIAQGGIGEPRLANFTSLTSYLFTTTDFPIWRFNEDTGGGWLGGSSPHLIDQIRVTLGEFASLSGAVETMVPQNGDADDAYAFRFRLTTGLEGMVQQATAIWGPGIETMRIMGTKGSIWLDGTEVKIADADGMRSVAIDKDLELPPMPPLPADPRHETAKWKFLVSMELPAYVRLSEIFLAVIEGREPSRTVPIPTFRDGLASMEVIDAIRSSSAHGGALMKLG